MSLGESRYYFSENGEMIDRITGEVVERPDRKNISGQSFVQFYDSVKKPMRKMGKTEHIVFWYIFDFMPTNTHHIPLNKYLRKIIAENSGYDKRTVDKSIRKLVDHEILIKLDRGSYAINPEHIWRGKYKMREAAISQLPIGYKSKDK